MIHPTCEMTNYHPETEKIIVEKKICIVKMMYFCTLINIR